MAELLKPGARSTDFWPVDKIILPYVAFTTVLLIGWWSAIAYAPVHLAWHIAAIALVVFEVKYPNRTSWFFRNWYPLPYVATCYKEMALYIPVVRRTDSDQWLANLDFRLWHANPTVWLERVQTPVLTEILQLAYTLFVPAVLLLCVVLWKQKRYQEFQNYGFLIALAFLLSYIGYLIVPARGPRFLLRHLQHMPLQGVWLFHNMQRTLDHLESAHYDCFPSGHTMLTILALYSSRIVSRRLFKVYFAYTPLLIFATVYLRYHYTVDLLAGAALAAGLILTAPVFYQKLSKGGIAIGRR